MPFMTNFLERSPFWPALFFFISGFCGLVYQIVWMRLAFASFGITTHVLSVVLSVFMAGLGLGSWLAGKWAPRLKAAGHSPLFFYALTEGFIGIGAFTVPALYAIASKVLLPSGNIQSGTYLFFSGLAILLSLMPWCFCMGATFPFMLASLEERTDGERNFSFLYTANSLGAVAGSLLTVIILVELLGFHHTLVLTGTLNFSLCAVCLWLSFIKNITPVKPASDPKRKVSGISIDPFSLVLLFTTGFVSMSMEVAWTRNFTPVLGNQVYTFAFILASYLLATTLGAWIYRRFPRDTFSLSVLLGSLFVAALLTIVLNDPRIQHRPWIVLASITPFCGLLGFLTPALVDRYSHGDPLFAGRAYAVNILGCILGPLFCSYLLLPFLGTRLSLLLLSLPFAYFAARTMKGSFSKNLFLGGWLGVGAILTLLVLLRTVDYEESYATFIKPSVMHRDSTATVVAYGTGFQKMLLVNGIGMTGLLPETKIMAHLPLAYLPHKPQSALDICFGMGTTFRALSSWGIQTTVVDLVPGVIRSFGYFWSDAAQVASDLKNRLVMDDGRRYLMRTNELYDVITIDPPPSIEAAGSSLLYSTEFYALAKQHLKPGGILQQWIPNSDPLATRSAIRSLKLSFPYIRAFYSTLGLGIHFLASLSPLPQLTAEQLVQRTPPSARKDLTEFFVDKDPYPVYNDLVKKEMPLSVFSNGIPVPLLTDDRPFNEYYLCRKFLPKLQSLWISSN